MTGTGGLDDFAHVGKGALFDGNGFSFAGIVLFLKKKIKKNLLKF